MRKPYIVGNWKMNLDIQQGVELAAGLTFSEYNSDAVDVAIAPSFVSLAPINYYLNDNNSTVALAAQNVSEHEEGAFTGEVSVSMLKSAGVSTIIVGHSERRAIYNEDDEAINKKLRIALSNGFEVILCVGETLFQRDADAAYDVVLSQIALGLNDVPIDKIERVTVAYEPVWAIGTGKTATPADAQKMHAAIREKLKSLYGPVMAGKIRILYGGSVKPQNIKGLMNQPDVDGALVGGASLKYEDFLSIINYND
ncbi:triose-phosphate isomerase [Limisalsivibrio acetivorans]|uniref:triose-phosphate isomerase n=1 Tax=Limisalsivibrio acetivorans TaxID=1304888 RepID=UPI0003B61CD2|nr:triose-phosphate isomerase [Limisalsivibrio acetivorans]